MILGSRIAMITALLLIQCDSFEVARGQSVDVLSGSDSINGCVELYPIYFRANRVQTKIVQDRQVYETTFEVSEILKGPTESAPKVGRRFKLESPSHQLDTSTRMMKELPFPDTGIIVRFVTEGEHFPNDLRLLCEEDDTDMLDYLAATADGIKSLKPGDDRRRIFVPYLCHETPMIARDALIEVTADGIQNIDSLKNELPREKLLKEFTNPKNSQELICTYGLLIGACGDPSDALLLEKKIVAFEDFRAGLENLIVGYLLLTREDGLKVIEETKFHAKTVKSEDGKVLELPFSEPYAGLVAIRILLTQGNNRIPRERLLQSMRLMLDRPGFTDLVISDLYRLKDWVPQDRIVAMFDDLNHAPGQGPAVRRAIVRYLRMSSLEPGEVGPDGKAVRPAHAIRAEEALEVLLQKDPKVVNDDLRYMYIPGMPDQEK